MSYYRTLSIRVLALLFALTAPLAVTPQASAGKFMDQTGCSQCCPECNHVCKLSAAEGEVEKKCFEVESEVICIPRVVFPWQRKARNSCTSCDGFGCSACIHNGAKTRKVKVLKSKKYKCPRCDYSWSAEKKPGSSSCRSCDRGNGGGCDAQLMPVPAQPQALQAVDAPAYSDAFGSGLEVVEVGLSR